MSVVRFKELDGRLAEELAAVATRALIKNLVVNGIDIPDL